MIGQQKLLSYIDSIITKFPGFVVIVGPRGSGKTTLCKLIAQKLNATFVPCGVKVDEVRDVINTAYTVNDKTLYCICNADTMRNEAKNALLKITEEPPKNANFIMTVEDDSTLLETIKSRAQIFKMDWYSKLELLDYAKTENIQSEEIELICETAVSPYEVKLLASYGKEFFDFVNLVIDNIAKVRPANAFKSSNKLCFKDGGEGYDLKLFFSTFTTLCLQRVGNDTMEAHKGSTGIIATTKYYKQCDKLGVNKQQLYDAWVFEIREVWNDNH